MTDTAVIIPHYNDVDRLVRCLEALMPQVSADMEVIVADNASSQSFEPVTSRWSGLRIVHQPEKGAGPARNAGVAATDAVWILFLDADCVPAPDWVETARRIRAPGVVFGGPVALFDETPAPKSGAEAFETVFAFQAEWYLRGKGFLPSCQLVMAHNEFERVGAFRTGVSEDVDWSRRAVAAGLRLDISQALRISHPSRSDWEALARKWRRLTREEYLLDGLNNPGRWIGKALLMPLSAIVHAPRVIACSSLTSGEKLRGLATLLRLRLARMAWMLDQVVRRQP